MLSHLPALIEMGQSARARVRRAGLIGACQRIRAGGARHAANLLVRDLSPAPFDHGNSALTLL
jgi:hypothetical protein